MGIDWLGPVPIDNEEERVTVNKLPDYLLEEEIQVLRNNISSISSEEHVLTEESMIHSFVVAKEYVYHAITQH